MRGYEELCALLRPLGVYRLDTDSLSGAELWAAGVGLDGAADALAHAEQESLLLTAEEEGLTLRERLFRRRPAASTTAQRRAAIAALLQIGGDCSTPAGVSRTLSGCGVNATVEETEKYGVVRVRFPDTVGEPEDFERLKSILLDILPCHLEAEFVFRFLTWAECEAQGFTWGYVQAQGWSWNEFEKAVNADE